MTDDPCFSDALLSVDVALARLLASATSPTASEDLPLAAAHGRVLARAIHAACDVPPTPTSAMDGYACASADLHGPGPWRLPISQRIPAGQVPAPHTPGSAARLFTGAALPPGADTVVMQEQCVEQGREVVISGACRPGTHVRQTGAEIAAGEALLAPGTRLRAQDLGLAATVGHSHLPCYQKLRVAMFCTGDELIAPGQPLTPGKIYNSNRATLAALLAGLHCEVLDLGAVPDTLAATQAALATAAQQADVVITSGGVSVGEEDHVKAALQALGHLELWRIAVKPGKPLAFGQAGDAAVIGLPGNPVSLFVTFCLFARPYLLKRQGVTNLQPETYLVHAGFEWPAGPRREYLRARLVNDEAVIHPRQSSAALISASWAEGLVCVPEHTAIARGAAVRYWPFSALLG